MIFVLTGPESTGKTTLANLLSKHYNAPLIEEYARTFLTNFNGDYSKNDVEMMAKNQLKLEEEAQHHKLLFLDTDLITYKIWLAVKYSCKIAWIDKKIATYNKRHYFLCATDVPWEADSLREHPAIEDRMELFNSYLKVLNDNSFSFSMLSGNLNERFEKCISQIENIKFASSLQK